MQEQLPRSNDTLHILVTGANSGLGFAICCRLVDEFLQSHGQSSRLVLIFTTRDQKKSDDTLRRLRIHLQKTLGKADTKQPGISKLLESRIVFQQELVDLTSLQAVHSLAQKLLVSIPKLDRLILNAGLGGWKGLDWPMVFWKVLTDFPHSITWPTYKIGDVGLKTKSQFPEGGTIAKQTTGPEPVLSQVFCANVFGHYLLTHFLLPLLSQTVGGRVIWLSSIETTDSSLVLDDIQGLRSKEAYESSKRLTDALVLTSRLPSTSRWTKTFLALPSTPSTNSPSPTAATVQAPPKMYLAHPGIIATTIVPLHPILQVLMTLAFILARVIGSPWHTVDSYTGACAVVWLALIPQSTIDAIEEREGPAKWGSAVDWRGDERVQRTEVDGWGFGGVIGDSKKFSKSVEYAGMRKGRRRGAKDASEESRAEFEQIGRTCWQEMERLRLDWEKRLAITSIPEPTLDTVDT